MSDPLETHLKNRLRATYVQSAVSIDHKVHFCIWWPTTVTGSPLTDTDGTSKLSGYGCHNTASALLNHTVIFHVLS
jgi:hypothetical protein